MTADTFSGTLGFTIMGTGNDNNSWGSIANSTVFQIFEDAIANFLASAITGGTLDFSGSPPPAAASQVRYAALVFTGALASDQTIKVPNLTKLWWVNNQTSGAHLLKIQTPSGSLSTAIPQNSGWQLVICDGANDIIVLPFNSQQIQMPDGSAAAPAYSDVNETNSGWYRHGTQDWRLSIGGVDILQVTGAGAGTPNIVNVLTPNSLQIAGVQVLPSGAEIPFAGVTVPAGFLLEHGQNVSRTTYANLLSALRISFTGTFVNGQATITGLSADPRGIGLVGGVLECATPGITNLTVSSTDSATQITMNTTATASSGGAVTFYIYPFGNGDGSTTFGIPDRRGYVLAGRDDMGGTDAGVIGNEINGTQLNATAGEEDHTLSYGEMPSHSHGVSDPGHVHSLTHGALGYGGSFDVGNGSTALAVNVDVTGTNVSATNIGINNAGGGGGHNNLQPTGISNYIIKI